MSKSPEALHNKERKRMRGFAELVCFVLRVVGEKKACMGTSMTVCPISCLLRAFFLCFLCFRVRHFLSLTSFQLFCFAYFVWVWGDGVT